MLVEVAVAIAGYVFRDQVSREWGGGTHLRLLWESGAGSLFSTAPTSLLLGEVRV